MQAPTRYGHRCAQRCHGSVEGRRSSFSPDVIQKGAGSAVRIQLNSGVPLNLGANSSVTILNPIR